MSKKVGNSPTSAPAEKAAAGASNSHRHGSVRRDITLPPWHDRQITARMDEQEISRSEAVRQLVSESSARRARLCRTEIRQRVTRIKLHCQEAKMRPAHLDKHLAGIEQAAEEISRMAMEI